jgi:hypothetical protein
MQLNVANLTNSNEMDRRVLKKKKNHIIDQLALGGQITNRPNFGGGERFYSFAKCLEDGPCKERL